MVNWRNSLLWVTIIQIIQNWMLRNNAYVQQNFLIVLMTYHVQRESRDTKLDSFTLIQLLIRQYVQLHRLRTPNEAFFSLKSRTFGIGQTNWADKF